MLFYRQIVDLKCRRGQKCIIIRLQFKLELALGCYLGKKNLISIKTVDNGYVKILKKKKKIPSV